MKNSVTGLNKLTCGLLWALLLGSLTPSVSLAQLKFRRISTAQGLSQSSVLSIYQDKQGFLWFGTADGLNRYDGYGFTVYRHQHQDTTTLASSDIMAVRGDEDGRLWVGTIANGINYLDPQTGHFGRVTLWAGKQQALMVSCIQVQQHDVWVGTYDHGLFHIDTKTMAVRWLSGQAGSVFESNTTAVTTGQHGTCWVATATGVVYQLATKPNRVKRRLVVDPKSGIFRVTALLEDSRGRLWIGTEDRGVYRLDPGQAQCQQVLYRSGQIGGTNNITTLYEDRAHRIWVGTDDGMLTLAHGDVPATAHYQANPESETGLSSHAVKSIMEDRDGNLWVGAWEAGLNVAYHQAERFKTLQYKPNQPNGILSHKVTAIGGDSLGTIWIGTNAGLTRWQPRQNTFTHVLPPRLPGLDVHIMYNRPTPRPLIGIWNQSLCVWDASTNRFRSMIGQLVAQDTITADPVRALAPARQGGVWVSTLHYGLLWFDPVTKRSRPYTRSADGVSLRSMQPTALCETADSTLWLGMFNSGLWAYSLRTGQTRQFAYTAQPGSLSENHILVLFEDSQKRLWVGTNGGGLNRFDPKTGRFIVYTTAQGLSSNTIKSILEDQHGNLWISTNNGLSRLTRDAKYITRYSIHDGLAGQEFMVQAAYRSPDNQLYFGSMDGLTYFHPDSIITGTQPIPVYLTGLRLFNRPVRIGGKGSPLQQPLSQTRAITLQADQSVFTIDFLGLDMQSAPNLQYAYRLDGFDTDWNYVGKQRSATYTNLDAGDYVFRVKVANGSGPWTESATSLKVRILPPWYRTTWAFLAYMLVLLGALWIWRHIIRIRERLRSDLRIQRIEAEKVREIDRLKTSFFTNISHEFRTPLTLIISPLEQLLVRNSPTDGLVRQQHGLMYRNARRLLQLINQLLDLSKLEAGHLTPKLYRNTLPDFVDRIVCSFEPAARQHQLDLRIDLDFPQQPVWYDPDVLEKVLTNLLANALKYTPDGGWIAVALQALPDDMAELSVTDTGVGIETDHLGHIFDRFYQADGQKQSKVVGTGIGLALTKELIELVGGTIAVSSEVGKGSTFIVRFPVADRYFAPHQLHDTTELLITPLPVDTPLPYEPETLQPTSRQTMLIVEDNDDLRAYIRSLFAHQFAILEAADGREGWEKASAGNPDVIISDLVMPHVNGVEFCRLVKNSAQTSHIPVILLTSRQNADSQLEGLTAGADDYVIKPFNAKVLEGRVLNLLRSREQLRERFSRVITVTPSEVTATSADEQFLTRLLQLIEERMDDANLSVADLEEALNMSESLLYRKLKNLTGLSGIEFIRSIRLKRAAQWLQGDSGLTISEIAFRVGFRDPAYFTRCFTKEFGQSPKQFSQLREVDKPFQQS